MNHDSSVLKKTYALHSKIAKELIGIPSFNENYTGFESLGLLGENSIYNTHLTTYQISFAMAMSNHELIEKLLVSKIKSPFYFNPEPLKEAQILKGQKILDLGCGLKPSFARTARKLGATVYTVDLQSANKFYSLENTFTSEELELERTNHLKVDLDNPEITNLILNKTKGDFDLVTDSSLVINGCYAGKPISEQVLKKDGLYFQAERNRTFLT